MGPEDVQPGDLVRAGDGQYYQLLSRDAAPVWGHMEPVPFFGPPWNPPGELELIARDGRAVEEP